MTESVHFGGLTAAFSAPDGAREFDLVLLHTAKDEGEALAKLFPGTMFVSVAGIDWNRDLSPWEAKGVFRGGGDFAGGAAEHLARLEPIPAFAERFGTVKRRFIAGYSLAGLFALYTVLTTDGFDGAASVSGSTWFDGFCDFAKDRTVRCRAVYFSLGDREPRAGNPRLAAVGDCTERLCADFAAKGVRTAFEWNPGGHFTDPAPRMERGIRWLLENG